MKPDMVKRNAVIRRYAPEVLEPSTRTTPLTPDELYSAFKAAGDESFQPWWYARFPDRFAGMNSKEIVEESKRLSNERPKNPGLTLEEFFEGNTLDSSIAPNLGPERPGIEEFYDTLGKIRERPEVLDVRITVHEWPDADDENDWIHAEHIALWVRGVEVADVLHWLRPLGVAGDWIGEARKDDIPFGGPPLELGVKVFLATWD